MTTQPRQAASEREAVLEALTTVLEKWLGIGRPGTLSTDEAISEAVKLARQARAALSTGAGEAALQVEPLPRPGSPEASAMIDSLLHEYGYPANTKNAARAGFEAARRMLASAPPPEAAMPLTDAQARKLVDDMEYAVLGHSTRGGLDRLREVREKLVAALLAAAPPLLVPPGWRVVPKEPTAPMLTALWNRKDAESPAALADAYRAMLDLAPEMKP